MTKSEERVKKRLKEAMELCISIENAKKKLSEQGINGVERARLDKRLRSDQSRLAPMTAALEALNEEERLVLTVFFLEDGKRKADRLTELLHYERTKIYDIRKHAVRKFLEKL